MWNVCGFIFISLFCYFNRRSVVIVNCTCRICPVCWGVSVTPLFLRHHSSDELSCSDLSPGSNDATNASSRRWTPSLAQHRSFPQPLPNKTSRNNTKTCALFRIPTPTDFNAQVHIHTRLTLSMTHTVTQGQMSHSEDSIILRVKLSC